MNDPLALLNGRHSTPFRQLGEPGPDMPTLRRLLEAAIRVPDHGKLVPFRLIVLQGDAKLQFGEALAVHARSCNPPLTEIKCENERIRYTYAPIVIVVVAHLDPNSPIPALEQLLSAGCVAYNLLLGAHALGYAAQWVTGWAAYDTGVSGLLGLKDHERVIAFVHLGTSMMNSPNRERPLLDTVLSVWKP